jgi:hypothetical protein
VFHLDKMLKGVLLQWGGDFSSTLVPQRWGTSQTLPLIPSSFIQCVDSEHMPPMSLFGIRFLGFKSLLLGKINCLHISLSVYDNIYRSRVLMRE